MRQARTGAAGAPTAVRHPDPATPLKQRRLVARAAAARRRGGGALSLTRRLIRCGAMRVAAGGTRGASARAARFGATRKTLAPWELSVALTRRRCARAPQSLNDPATAGDVVAAAYAEPSPDHGDLPEAAVSKSPAASGQHCALALAC